MQTRHLLSVVAFTFGVGGCSAPGADDADQTGGAVSAEGERPAKAPIDLRALSSRITKRVPLYPTDEMLLASNVRGKDTRPVVGRAHASLGPDEVVRFDLPPANFNYVTFTAGGTSNDAEQTLICAVDGRDMGRCVEGDYQRLRYFLEVTVRADEGTVAILVAQKPFVESIQSGVPNANKRTAAVYLDGQWDVPKGDVVLPTPPH